LILLQLIGNCIWEPEYRIQQELAVANKQTEANQARDTRKIEVDLAVKRRTTEVDRELQIVAQENAIIVATKSKEQSEAQTIAETARALAIAAEEKVTTARSIEIAERDKAINVIAARKAAETNAMPITVMAEAEKQAAANKAEAINVLAKADANAATTRASGVKSRPGRGRSVDDSSNLAMARKHDRTPDRI
jgi:flotillin